MRIGLRGGLGVAALVLAAAAGIRWSAGGGTPASPPEGGRAWTMEVSRAGIAEIAGVADATYAAGRWYLADPRTHRVHVLDSAGGLLRSFGGPGAGPGELREPARVAATADRIYVAERRRPDVSVFDTAGAFLARLRPDAPCPAGRPAGLAVAGGVLHVLRQCLEPPRHVRYQVERALDDRALSLWPAVADTVPLPRSGQLPFLHVLLAGDDARLALAEGQRGCVRFFRVPGGEPDGVRCLDEVPRLPLREEERAWLARYRGRAQLPDSLPRFLGLLLRGAELAVFVPADAHAGRWLVLPAAAPPARDAGDARRARGGPFGTGPHRRSFVAADLQLVVSDGLEGMALEVVPVRR
jgi:hypothetical protein